MTDPPPLRRFGVRVAAIVRETGIPHDSVLKDHALGYLLAGISRVPDLRANLAFKGGTALRKCFFPQYRYSEDLDFSTQNLLHWSATELLSLLQEACGVADELTAAFGTYSFVPRVSPHRADHPHDQLDFRVDVALPTGASHPMKIEVSQQEPIVRPIADRRVLHAFAGEELKATIPTYSLDEIVLEKLRAFLQVRASLQSRGWTGRARDLFDLYVLHHDHRELIRWGNLLEFMPVKAAARGVVFSGADDFRAPEVLAAYREQWTGRLENLVAGSLPEFDDAVAELQAILASVFGQRPHRQAAVDGP